MQSEDGRWDPATVLGLGNARVLVVGNPAFLPWLRPLFERWEDGLVAVRKASQIDALLKKNERFDRMVLTRETPYTHEHVLYAGAIRAQLVAFPKTEGDAWAIEQSAKFYYPRAVVRNLDSTFGPILIADRLDGASWRMIFA